MVTKPVEFLNTVKKKKISNPLFNFKYFLELLKTNC